MCAPSWAVQYAVDARRFIKVSGGVVVTNLLVFAAATVVFVLMLLLTGVHP
jgi:hypothetical protein